MRCFGVVAPVTSALEFSLGGVRPVMLSSLVAGPSQLSSNCSGSLSAVVLTLNWAGSLSAVVLTLCVTCTWVGVGQFVRSGVAGGGNRARGLCSRCSPACGRDGGLSARGGSVARYSRRGNDIERYV